MPRPALVPLVLLGLGSVACGALRSAPRPVMADPVELHFSLETASGIGVCAEVHCAGSPDGRTVLEVSDHWGGVDAGGADILDVVVSDSRGHELPLEHPAAHRWVAIHEPGAPLRVSWRFARNDLQTDPDPARHRRPLLGERLFHTVGYLGLVLPASADGDAPRRVRVSWSGFERAGWETCSSFGVEEGPHEAVASLNELRGGLFVAGRGVRVHRRRVHGRQVVVTVEGARWRFEDEAFVDVATRIVELERDFFDDHEDPFYWISLIAIGEPSEHSRSIGGTGLTHCFSMCMLPDASLDPEAGGREVLRVLAHETFHEWNGLVIERRDPEELVYWFSEGATDFYARRLLYRAGWLDVDEYAASLNDMLAAYFQSPVRSEPNERILEDFWSSTEVQRLPYLRGDLVALLVDGAIRRASGGARSLDDLMRELVREAREDGQRIDTELLLGKIASHADAETAERVRAIVVSGAEPRLDEDLLAPCLELERVDMGGFDPGFDVSASTRERVVQGVAPGSAAWRAGLRDGIELAGWSVYYGEPTREIVLQVRDPEGEREVRFLPQGPPISTPQFAVGDRAACETL